jgi:hypothetical protein
MNRSAMFVAFGLLLQAPFITSSSIGAEKNKTVDCIQLSRIDHTEVINDRNIAFFMKGGDVYLNRLRHSCPNLDDRHAFSYRTPVGRLCSVDVITVLEDYGLGLTRGASCGLGMFEPADADLIASLRGDVDDDDGAVRVTPVEVKPADAESTEAEPTDSEP